MISFATLILLLLTSCPTSSHVTDDDFVLAYLAGTVRDAENRPIAGAKVSLTGMQGFTQTRTDSPGTGFAISDASGHYKLAIYTKPVGSVEVLGLRAEGKGYICVQHDYQNAYPVLRPNATSEINVVLMKGEVLTGKATVLPHRSDTPLTQIPDAESYVVRVRGESFTQTYRTEPGGAFEIWVPKGKYILELFNKSPSPTATLKNIPSGSRDLNLAEAEIPVTRDALARAFDGLAADMSKNYSHFASKKIDWPAVQAKYRERAVAADTLSKFVQVMSEMLAELDDGHIWFNEPVGVVVPRRRIQPPYNGNAHAMEADLDNATNDVFARLATTKGDGFGVVAIIRQSNADQTSVQKVVEFIRNHADAPGFIVDLRRANGGNEMFARQIAAEFCAAKSLYAKSKYRNGPKPTDFGQDFDRYLEPSAKPFKKPVVCILGPGCVSSGEGFAQMLVCLPQVTSVGVRTRGSSGNPRPYKLPGLDVTVMYSRWVDMMPDGSPIEDRGIQSAVVVDLPRSAYEKIDPTWNKAIEVLRAKVAEAKK
jgi:hypothetical protein